MTSPVWCGRNAGTGYSRFSAPISYGLVGWWNREDLPAAGSLIATWTNRVTGGVALTAAGGARPTSTAVGSRLCARFDGAANNMQSAFVLAQPITFHLVYRQLAFGGVGANDVVLTGAAGNASYITDTGPRTLITAGVALQWLANVANNVFAEVDVIFNGAASGMYLGTVPLAVGNTGAWGLGGISLGASAVPNRFTNIDVMDLLVYNRALASLEMDHNRRYLEEHCGL